MKNKAILGLTNHPSRNRFVLSQHWRFLRRMRTRLNRTQISFIDPEKYYFMCLLVTKLLHDFHVANPCELPLPHLTWASLEPSVMGGGGGGYHNFVVVAPMIMKFGSFMYSTQL